MIIKKVRKGKIQSDFLFVSSRHRKRGTITVIDRNITTETDSTLRRLAIKSKPKNISEIIFRRYDRDGILILESEHRTNNSDNRFDKN